MRVWGILLLPIETLHRILPPPFIVAAEIGPLACLGVALGPLTCLASGPSHITLCALSHECDIRYIGDIHILCHYNVLATQTSHVFYSFGPCRQMSHPQN
jgi:hypothetical protein